MCLWRSGGRAGWPVLAAYARLFGLELTQLAIDGCITKAPCGGQTAGPSPTDRRKQDLKRSVAVEAGGIPPAVLAAPGNHRGDGLLAATLGAAVTVTGRCDRSAAWTAHRPPGRRL